MYKEYCTTVVLGTVLVSYVYQISTQDRTHALKRHAAKPTHRHTTPGRLYTVSNLNPGQDTRVQPTRREADTHGHQTSRTSRPSQNRRPSHTVTPPVILTNLPAYLPRYQISTQDRTHAYNRHVAKRTHTDTRRHAPPDPRRTLILTQTSKHVTATITVT